MAEVAKHAQPTAEEILEVLAKFLAQPHKERSVSWQRPAMEAPEQSNPMFIDFVPGPTQSITITLKGCSAQPASA